MNIMNRLTWKSMVKNRTRTIVTAIGIALSAALFCAVTTMGASILSYLIDLQIAIGGDYHVSAVTLTQEEADTIRSREDVASFAETQTLGVVNFYGEEMGFNSGMVKACNQQYFETMPTVLKEGRLPQNSGEFVIGEYLLHTMEAQGYPTDIGSKVTLMVTPYVETMAYGDADAPAFTVTGTIVGIHDMNSSVIAPGDAGEFSYIFTCLDEKTPAPLYCDLFLKAENPYVAADLAAAIRGNTNYSLLQYYGVVEAGNVTIIIGAIMAAIISIVMVGTVSLISNAFSISVAQKTQQFGLLSSVGATKKQLRRSVHFEAGLLCLMGIPAGILLGFVSVILLLNAAGDTVESMVASMQSGVQIKAVVNPVALLGATLITAAAVFLSAWRPSARAARVTPMMAIRQEAEYQTDKKLAKTARKWWRPGKVSANMASKYYRTNRKKYRSIVFALGISVVLFLSTTAVSGSLQYMADSYYDTENYDFRVGLIYQLRTEKEMSQGDLADALEVSRQSISKWENGVSVPELEKLVKLCEVFGITLDELVTGDALTERPTAEPQVVYVEKPVERKNTKAQKWCIALCSLLCVLLLANLVATILPAKGEPDPQASSGPVQQVPQDFEIAASDVRCMDIEWSAGAIRILTADTDKITVAAPNSAELVGDVLKILPNADSDEELVITVPRDWNCQNMKLQCDGTTVDLRQLSVKTLVLNGSDCAWAVSGDIETIGVTGNRSNLDLTLPQDRGFQVELDWVHNTFHSVYSGVRFDGSKYLCGDQYCKIKVDGLSCVVFIGQSK